MRQICLGVSLMAIAGVQQSSTAQLAAATAAPDARTLVVATLAEADIPTDVLHRFAADLAARLKPHGYVAVRTQTLNSITPAATQSVDIVLFSGANHAAALTGFERLPSIGPNLPSSYWSIDLSPRAKLETRYLLTGLWSLGSLPGVMTIAQREQQLESTANIASR